MTEPFHLQVDVDEQHLGSVLRKIDEMPGVLTIHLRVNKNGSATQQLPHNPGDAAALVRTITKQGKATLPALRQRGSSSELKRTIANALQKGAMHYHIIQEVLRRSGFSGHSAAGVLNRMTSAKLVKRVSPGVYKLTSLGERKYVNNTERQNLKPDRAFGPTTNNGKGLRGFILARLSERGYPHPELKVLLVNNGYVVNNIYTLLPRMIEEGLVARVDGTYEITDQGRKALVPAMEAPTIEGHANVLEHHGDSR